MMGVPVPRPMTLIDAMRQSQAIGLARQQALGNLAAQRQRMAVAQQQAQMQQQLAPLQLRQQQEALRMQHQLFPLQLQAAQQELTTAPAMTQAHLELLKAQAEQARQKARAIPETPYSKAEAQAQAKGLQKMVEDASTNSEQAQNALNALDKMYSSYHSTPDIYKGSHMGKLLGEGASVIPSLAGATSPVREFGKYKNELGLYGLSAFKGLGRVNLAQFKTLLGSIPDLSMPNQAFENVIQGLKTQYQKVAKKPQFLNELKKQGIHDPAVINSLWNKYLIENPSTVRGTQERWKQYTTPQAILSMQSGQPIAGASRTMPSGQIAPGMTPPMGGMPPAPAGVPIRPGMPAATPMGVSQAPSIVKYTIDQVQTLAKKKGWTESKIKRFIQHLTQTGAIK